MLHIWRVQNAHGIGPYQAFKKMPQCLEHHNGSNAHPTPSADFGINRSPHEEEICGFISLQQAYSWFTPEELRELELLGFELTSVSVERITVHGCRQVLAIPSKN